MTVRSRRALLAVAACAALVGVGGCQGESAPVSQDMDFLTKPEPKITGKPDFFPLRRGSRWTMQQTAGGLGARVVFDVAGPRKVGPYTGTVVETSANGKVVQQDVLHVDGSGVKRLARGPKGQVVLDPPMPLLRYPVRNGDSYAWRGTLKVAGKSSPADAAYAVTGPETITVKDAGGSEVSYATYRLDVAMSMRVNGQDEPMPFSMWFAPDVGVVKHVTTLRGQQIDLELEPPAKRR